MGDRPTRKGVVPVMSAFDRRKLHTFIGSPRQHHPIHCRLPTHRSPVARRPLHHVLSIDRLPGRAESCAPGCRPPVAAPRSRNSRRIAGLPVWRCQRHQVREQRLRRPRHDTRPGGQGWYAIPAATRPDRRPAALCIPCTPAIEGHDRLHGAPLTLNCSIEHRQTVDLTHSPRIRASGSSALRVPHPREPGPRGQVPPR